jgi:hypothetical protein
MTIIEVIGLFLIGIVSIMLFFFQGNLWNPWNGKKEKELFDKHHDWSKVDKEMKPKRKQQRYTLIALAAVWLIGIVLELVGKF